MIGINDFTNKEPKWNAQFVLCFNLDITSENAFQFHCYYAEPKKSINLDAVKTIVMLNYTKS